ncbi:hypothetical protein BDY17DRAFT_296949 [Neohortaea acidophila]|uniref:Secreted protein n=1 Tax=Neohortaea acidophila TaxID=245834 RepID=A0A6A6PUR4_9PEZI|nr:uncharacterized protein BDY17DRAFT_296949 [Neohortaea acidophila]KAF2483173.1 hypothetical protein BDY17DRAFT_296949 [Neohortaea acidophila]
MSAIVVGAVAGARRLDWVMLSFSALVVLHLLCRHGATHGAAGGARTKPIERGVYVWEEGAGQCGAVQCGAGAH